MTDYHFSPSEYHMGLLAETEREFVWRGQDFATWQARLRERFSHMLGYRPARQVPLVVEELETVETDTDVRTKLVFTSEPMADVPAWLLVPKGVPQPLPAMICLQGHSPGMHISLGMAETERDRELISGGDRDFALQAVRNGFVALAIEQRCFGERREALQEHRWEHPCFDAVFHSLLLGKTVLGERVWDVMRGIDVLERRPEVDASRIACMGNSGGGKIAFYAACVEPRIALAVASCTFCTYAESNMRFRGCPDNIIPGILRVAEMGELAGLIAPRKLILVSGQTDVIFPIEGARRGYEQAREIFAAAGCPQNVRHIVGPQGHRFYADLTWPVIHEMMA